MASEREEEDLDALRNAVLESMKNKNAPQEDSDSDEDLEALRQAALRAKNKKNENANGSAIHASVGFRPDPKSLLTECAPEITSVHVRPNYLPRGPHGAGNVRFPGRGGGFSHQGGFRGKANFPVRPSASNQNLIVIQTVPLDGEKEPKETKPFSGNPVNKPLMIRPQDRWAGTGDESSQSPTPKPKVSARFRRYESSSSSDSDSSGDSSDSSDNESNSDKENESSTEENEGSEGSSNESGGSGNENDSDNENEGTEKDSKGSDNENEKTLSRSNSKNEAYSPSPSPEISRETASKNLSRESSRESSPELTGTRFARPKKRKSDSESDSPERSGSKSPVGSGPSADRDVKSSPKLQSTKEESLPTDKCSALKSSPEPALGKNNEKRQADSSLQISSTSSTVADKHKDFVQKEANTESSVKLSQPLDRRRSKDRSSSSRGSSPTRRKRSPIDSERYHCRSDRSPVRDRYRSKRSPERDPKLSGSRVHDRLSDRHHRPDRYDSAEKDKSRSPSSRTRTSPDSHIQKSERKRDEEKPFRDVENKRQPTSASDPVLEARRQKFESRKEISAKDIHNAKISLKGITSKKNSSKKVVDSSSRKNDQPVVSSSKRRDKTSDLDKSVEESDQQSSSSISSMSDSDSEDSNDAPWRSKKATERGTGDIEKERRIRAKAHRQLSVEEREERRRRRSVREERRRSRGEQRDTLSTRTERKPDDRRERVTSPYPSDSRRERKHDERHEIVTSSSPHIDRRERKPDARREMVTSSNLFDPRKADERHELVTTPSPSKDRRERRNVQERVRRVDAWESDEDELPTKPVVKSFLNVVKTQSNVNSSRDSSPSGSRKPSIKDRLGVKRVTISPAPLERDFKTDLHPRDKSRSKSKERSKSRERRVTKLSPSPVRGADLPPNDLRLEKLSKKKKKRKKRRHSDKESEEEMDKMPKVVVNVDKPGRRVMKDDVIAEDARVVIGKKKKYPVSEDEASPEREENPSFRITFDKIKKYGKKGDQEEKSKPSVHERLGMKVTPEKPKKHKKHKKDSKPDRRVITDDNMLSSHRRKVVAVDDDEIEEKRISRLKLKRPQKAESVVQKRIKLNEKLDLPPARRSESSHGGDTEAELDAKIREIQRKNEAINQRQRQIQQEKLRFGH